VFAKHSYLQMVRNRSLLLILSGGILIIYVVFQSDNGTRQQYDEDDYSFSSRILLTCLSRPSCFPPNRLLYKEIFSWPFFSVDSTVSPPRFLVSEKFRIFWSVVAPVTVIVVVLWLAYDHITVKRFEKALKSY
jgi:hypothetical protein